MMAISIIIATLDRHEDLTRCLASLNKALQNNQPLISEVIIVDQSKDLYVATQKYLFPLLIVKAQPGASHARNIGLSHCTGNYVWFLDDDAQIVRFLPFFPSQIEGSPILFSHWKERPCPAKKYLTRSLLSKFWLIRISGTPFFLLPRSLATAAGGFDEHLGPGQEIAAGEDLDLLIRAHNMTRARSPIIFIAELSHTNKPQPEERKILYARSRGYVLAKNNWRFMLAAEIIYSLFAALKGNKSRLASIFEGCTMWHQSLPASRSKSKRQIYPGID